MDEMKHLGDSKENLTKSCVGNTRGLALVCHGLNLKPDCMKQLCIELNNMGLEVLNIVLSGHSGLSVHAGLSGHSEKENDLHLMTREYWLTDLQNSIFEIDKKLLNSKVPVYFFGYSLGAALMLEFLLTKKQSFQFNKIVLIAPAIGFRFHINLLLQMSKVINSQIQCPSFALPSYRVSAAIPFSAYQSLIEIYSKILQSNVKNKLNIPTLVFLNKKDEFINHKKIKEFIINNKLDLWSVYYISKSKDAAKKFPHHLMIDENSLGEEKWLEFIKAMESFLFENIKA